MPARLHVRRRSLAADDDRFTLRWIDDQPRLYNTKTESGSRRDAIVTSGDGRSYSLHAATIAVAPPNGGKWKIMFYADGEYEHVDDTRRRVALRLSLGEFHDAPLGFRNTPEATAFRAAARGGGDSGGIDVAPRCARAACDGVVSRSKRSDDRWNRLCDEHIGLGYWSSLGAPPAPAAVVAVGTCCAITFVRLTAPSRQMRRRLRRPPRSSHRRRPPHPLSRRYRVRARASRIPLSSCRNPRAEQIRWWFRRRRSGNTNCCA